MTGWPWRFLSGLEESERKYRQLHEAMIDAFVKFGEHGRVREFNEAFRSMLRYEWGELEGLTDEDLTPEKWRAFEAGVVESQVLVRGYSDVYEKVVRPRSATTLRPVVTDLAATSASAFQGLPLS